MLNLLYFRIMKKITIGLLSIVAGIVLLNAQNNEALIGPYLGQEPPQLQSRVFAPGFISTDAGELNSVFCSDGNEFYFSRRGIPGRPSALMVSKRINDTWSKPEQLEFSGDYGDIDLFVTADGKSMIFCSKRPNRGKENEKADHDFWISKRAGDNWSEPVPFAVEAMSEYEDFYPVVTSSGNLYFNSQRGGRGGNNIYCSRCRNGTYAPAEKLIEPISSVYWEFDAFVSRDEQMILFSSTRPGGYGGADIYMSYRKADAGWSEPKNLGPEVNSENYEYGASLSPDGKYLFYTSSRNGSEDIFWISAEILNYKAAPVTPVKAVKSNGEVFMSCFQKNWDDIHDVIMRYHYTDPYLKGLVSINMTWRKGILTDAEVLENNTGNIHYGKALIEAMKNWIIPEFDDAWSSAMPIKTTIKGSDDPAFDDCGILTGKVTDQNNKPLFRAMVILQRKKSSGDRSDTLYTNREGIFIQTLILPGTLELKCSKAGYKTISMKDIKIEKGHHCKQDFILRHTENHMK